MAAAWPSSTVEVQPAASSTEHAATTAVVIDRDATLAISGSFEWTHDNSVSAEQKTTQSASATLGGPSFGYSGPAIPKVYWDTLFNTFAFELVE